MSIVKRHGQVFHLPITVIAADTANTKREIDHDALCALADSINKYGVLQPITVRRLESGYGLVAGERRLRAAKMAGLTRIPCLLVDADETDSSILALVENLHRQDLDFIQEAEALHQLITTYGLNQEEAARRVGRTQSAVANKLRILKLSGEVLYLIRESNLTERHARALLRLDNEEQQMRVLDKIINESLNVAKTDALIDSMLETNEKPPRPVYIIRDIRMFMNTVDKGITLMNQAGVAAECKQMETDKKIVLTVTIPKMM